MQKFDKWSTMGAAALMVGALLACKKEEPPPPTPVAEAPPPEPPKEEAKPDAEAKKDDDEVKRYGSAEQTESGTVRVDIHHAKVYKETDETTSHIATLSRHTLVNRKARKGTWMLIDYPSGVGQLSPGWIPSKHLTGNVEKVSLEEITKQDAAVAVTPTTTATAVVDATAPTTTATAEPTATATTTAEPTPTATATATEKKGRLKVPFKLPTGTGGTTQ